LRPLAFSVFLPPLPLGEEGRRGEGLDPRGQVTVPRRWDATPQGCGATPWGWDATPQGCGAMPWGWDATPRGRNTAFQLGNTVPQGRGVAFQLGDAMPQGRGAAFQLGNAVPQGRGAAFLLGDAAPQPSGTTPRGRGMAYQPGGGVEVRRNAAIRRQSSQGPLSRLDPLSPPTLARSAVAVGLVSIRTARTRTPKIFSAGVQDGAVGVEDRPIAVRNGQDRPRSRSSSACRRATSASAARCASRTSSLLGIARPVAVSMTRSPWSPNRNVTPVARLRRAPSGSSGMGR